MALSLCPVSVNTTWEDIEYRDKDEEDEAYLDAEKRDPNRQQVDERGRQVSACCPLHELRIYIPVYQVVVAGGIPPQQLKHQTRNYQRAPIDDDGYLLLWILSNERRGKGDKHNAQQQQQVEPEQDAIRAFDVVEGIVMSDPVDADDHEAQHIKQEFGPQLEQPGQKFP